MTVVCLREVLRGQEYPLVIFPSCNFLLEIINWWLVKVPFELRLSLNNVPMFHENLFGIMRCWNVSGYKRYNLSSLFLLQRASLLLANFWIGN